MRSTHILVNANGLHDPDHYTTAYDMALITQYALGVEGFREYWCAEEYTIQPTNKQSQERNLGTQHSMFVESQFTYEGCTGGKLGYTDEAAAYFGHNCQAGGTGINLCHHEQPEIRKI